METEAEKAERLELMTKRMESLAIAWLGILERKEVSYKRLFTLNPAIASKVVFHYTQDLDILKKRYRINNKAQPPKIAGLMAASILKYRPIIPIDGNELGIEECCINEFLAIFHGICVCANYRKKDIGNHAMAALMAKSQFRQWHDRFIFLLKERNYTSESLIMLFETLCLFAFSDTINIGED